MKGAGENGCARANHALVARSSAAKGAHGSDHGINLVIAQTGIHGQAQQGPREGLGARQTTGYTGGRRIGGLAMDRLHGAAIRQFSTVARGNPATGGNFGIEMRKFGQQYRCLQAVKARVCSDQCRFVGAGQNAMIGHRPDARGKGRIGGKDRTAIAVASQRLGR